MSTFVNFIHQKDALIYSIAIQVVEEVLLKGAPVYTVHEHFITTAPYARKIPDIYSLRSKLSKEVYQSSKNSSILTLNLIEPTLSNYTREGEAFLLHPL